MLIFLITQDCPPRESTHNELFFSHSFCPSVCPSHFLPFPPSFSFFVTLYSQFSRLLFHWPKLAKNIVLIKLVGHRSEQLIEKSFTGLLKSEWKARLKCFFSSNYRLDHKPYCVWVISLITVQEFIILFFLLWDSSSSSLIYMQKWPTARNHKATSPPTLKEPCGVFL